MRIKEDLNFIRDGLQSWGAANKAAQEIAKDMVQFFQILSIKPGGFAVSIHFVGEAKRGEYEEGGFADRTYWVGLTFGKSTQIRPGENLVKADSGGRAIADLGEECRDTLRAMNWDPISTESHINYLGMWPLRNIRPDFDVDGLYIHFTIGVQLPAPQSA